MVKEMNAYQLAPTAPRQLSPTARRSNVACTFAFEDVISNISEMPWNRLGNFDILKIAKVYYYFSIQFRENLEIACELYPADENLKKLKKEECNTDNLSPFSGIAEIGEKMDHDEFMRRLLLLERVGEEQHLERLGLEYLRQVRSLDKRVRALSIVSYEDGGLSTIFQAILRVPHWHGPGPNAFKFFLEEHVKFDLDDNAGHGALSRHMEKSDEILPLWSEFENLLVGAVPLLGGPGLHLVG